MLNVANAVPRLLLASAGQRAAVRALQQHTTAVGTTAAATVAARHHEQRAHYTHAARFGAGPMSLELRRAVSTHTARFNDAVSSAAAAAAPAGNGNNNDLSTVMAQPPETVRSVVVRLLQTLTSKKEVDHYLRFYGNAAPTGSSRVGTNVVVIKVGGGLIRDELDSLVSSLAFLVDVGLVPVVIHGAGPQLNAKLEAKGIVSDYHGGIRVTTPEILSVARQTFAEENMKLLEALESRGIRCRGFVGGVFTASLLDEQKFGLVGEVNSVDTRAIRSQISKNVVPIITCSAESSSGQVLNVNADVAAHQLAKDLQPVKVVYLSQNGGLRDNEGKLMSMIDVGEKYDELMSQPWFTKGNRLKLKEIKSLLDSLPLASSVSITSAQQLPTELFTHKGCGTLVKRTERMLTHTSMDSVDQDRLGRLLESSFGGKLSDNFFEELRKNLAGIYVSEHYTATAVVTKLQADAKGLEHVAYLDKFGVDPSAQGTGAAQKLWDVLTTHHPAIVWRSRVGNPINTWYCDHSDGCYTPPGSSWTVFWSGLSDLPTAQKAIEIVLAKVPNLARHPKGASGTAGSPRNFASYAKAAHKTASAQRRGVRYFSSSAASPAPAEAGAAARRLRVGIIGARGFTGGELIQLFAHHPQFQLVSANSRACVGQTVETVVPELKHSDVDWKHLQFGSLSPAELHKASADLWVLALPNGVAKPFVDALQAKRNASAPGGKARAPKLIDLSADYRFDNTWTYGLPEAKGNRDLIAQATQVANPGCYATAAQLALMPFLRLLAPGQAPSAFGVSGYSGAGTTPSRKNDPVALKDNLMPYALGGHIHEREVTAQLRRIAQQTEGASAAAGGLEVQFVPHVAPWFRGITMTVTATLTEPLSDAALREALISYYDGSPLVRVAAPGAIPEVSAIAGRCGAQVAAYSSPTASRPGRIVVIVTLDNLLKGAASQCMQNINLMFGFPELTGIHTSNMPK